MKTRPLWTGKVVVVTGASAGIGRAIARAFAERGARVGLIARGREGLEAAKSEVEALGGRAIIATADVADERQVERAAVTIERELGPIDVWVNNAMVTVFAPVHEMTPDEFRRVTNVTYLGYVWGTHAALRRMRPKNHGVIVQIGGALGHRAMPLQAAHCAAKHAVRGFTEALRTELLHDRSAVRVVSVDLPAVNTPQFDWSHSHLRRRPRPIAPVFQPERIAQAVVRTAGRPRREVILTWSSIKTILAGKIAPGLLEHVLARTGYEAQQTNEVEDPHRPDNLWSPVTGDHGAHGRFDDHATASSLVVWATFHHRFATTLLVALCAATSIALAAMMTARARRRSSPTTRWSGWWERRASTTSRERFARNLGEVFSAWAARR